MKKFIIKCIVFALLMAATLAVGEVLVRSLPNPYKKKQAYMEANAERVRTVILGNSHSYFGIIPSMLGNQAVNLANVSQTLKYDRRIFEKWAPRLDSLQLVIMHVGFTSLFDDDMENTGDWVFVPNYEMYMDIHTHPLFSRYRSELANISLYNNKIGVFFGFKESNLGCDSLGHTESYTFASKYEGWDEFGKTIVSGHNKGVRLDKIPENIAQINAIDSICRRKGAKLAFVTMPEWHTYREGVSPDYLRRFNHLVDSITRSKGIPWLCYWDDRRFDADDFYDADHLNSDRGAVKATRIILEDLERIGYLPPKTR